MINQLTVQEHIRNEFYAGYVYLSMAEYNNDYKNLAKEKIESGMRIFDWYKSLENRNRGYGKN